MTREETAWRDFKEAKLDKLLLKIRKKSIKDLNKITTNTEVEKLFNTLLNKLEIELKELI